MCLRAPKLPLALSLAAILLAGCGGSGGDRFVGRGSPPPREPTTEDREGRAEEILKGLEFLNQTDMRLVFVEEMEDEDGDGNGDGTGDGDGTGNGNGNGDENENEEEVMRKVSPSELQRINAHHAYGYTHRGAELLDETGDISGFGVYVGVGGLGLEHNHEKIMGRLFQSVVPYPEDAFDVLRIDTDAAANQEFSAQELLASLDKFGDIDAVGESFEARKKALVRSLTSQYYSHAEAANSYPDQDDVDSAYIIHIDDIKDLTDDGFDDQKRFTYLRDILNWAEENDFTGPDDFDPEDPTVIPPIAGDGTTDKDLTDNFRYIVAVCADKGDYSNASTGICDSDKPHFIDFGDRTPEGRDLRLIPDFSQRLLGSQAPGLIANERNIHLANLSSLPVEEENED
ncbi:MAG: hypothetical protein OXF09_09175, partial [Hyphomicrobiales bacterium]|nr:hypothetical protein [Hyphomicrobiales bacterium]